MKYLSSINRNQHSIKSKVMKKSVLIVAMLLGCFAIPSARAQVHINIGIQPIWGPVGYDYVNYYYLPDVEAYYSVPDHMFFYLEGGVWTHGGNLPGRYHDFDLYHAHKVVINESQPWLRHAQYRDQYISFRGHQGQAVIRDSHENRYRENREHPEHNKWDGNKGGERHVEEHRK
jgi:hypothetical protein